MDVVILCGGLGTRLRGVIGESAKVMAKFEDKPFIDILISLIAEQGFQRFILCTGYQSEEVEQYFQENSKLFEVVISKEESPLGTGGAIKNARDYVLTDHFLALNGDCYCELNYEKFVQYHLLKKGISTIVLSPTKEEKDFGSVDISDDGQVSVYQEKDSSVNAGYVSNGIYCFQKDVFNMMPDQDKFSLEYDVFPKLVGNGLYGYTDEQGFLDIGTPERFAKAQDGKVPGASWPGNKKSNA
jgi:D-glycero-alpha-D-manno-heptose 1-phosphate guanylyltransferase